MRTWSNVTVITFILGIFSSCKGPEGPVGPRGPSGQGIGSLSDPLILPHVIYTYPPQNSTGPYEDFYVLLGWYYSGYDPSYYVPIYMSQFQVRFNKFMDVSSLRRSLAITSPLGDVRVDTNYVISIGGDVFLVNPVDTNGSRKSLWRIGQNYTFTISAGARDINGNYLQQTLSVQPAFSMNFMPEPYFRVRSVTPANGAINVEPYYYSNIVLSFNSPMDTSIGSMIHIDPPITGSVSGIYLSYDSTSWSIAHQDLKTGTTYTITVGTDAHDKYGNHLLQPFVSTFTTTPFKVDNTYPENGYTGIGVMETIDVGFTSELDTATIRAAFKIDPSVAGQFSIYYPATSFQFTPTAEYLLDTRYTVTIDTSIRSNDGLRISAPYSFSFITQSFQVASTYPWDGYTGFSPYTPIQVYGNALIDTGSVRASFQLLDSANVPLTGSFIMSTNSFSFSPVGYLKPNAAYKIIISTGFRAKQGEALKTPVSASFTTGT